MYNKDKKRCRNLIEEFLLENKIATEDELLSVGDIPSIFLAPGKQKVEYSPDFWKIK